MLVLKQMPLLDSVHLTYVITLTIHASHPKIPRT